MQSLFVWLWNIDFNNRYFKLFDWGTAVASLVIGVWSENVLMIILGFIGVGLACYRPLDRYQKWMKSSVIKRKGV